MRVLADTGCYTGNLLDTRLAQRPGLAVTRRRELPKVHLADNSDVDIEGTCRVKLHIGKFVETWSLWSCL